MGRRRPRSLHRGRGCRRCQRYLTTLRPPPHWRPGVWGAAPPYLQKSKDIGKIFWHSTFISSRHFTLASGQTTKTCIISQYVIKMLGTMQQLIRLGICFWKKLSEKSNQAQNETSTSTISVVAVFPLDNLILHCWHCSWNITSKVTPWPPLNWQITCLKCHGLCL